MNTRISQCLVCAPFALITAKMLSNRAEIMRHQVLHNFVESMPARVHSDIKAKDAQTKY